jgi:hypothetical protein
MDKAQPASARTLGVPRPWVPASAGMTSGEGESPSPNTVIPAQAGIQTRRCRDGVVRSARLNPRLRGDDKAGEAPLTIIGSAARSVTNPTPSSSRRTPGPMDAAQPATARTLGVPHPRIPAPAGMTKREGEPTSRKAVVPAAAGMTNPWGTRL